MRSTHSWPMLDRRRYGSTHCYSNLPLITISQDYDAARDKALKVGAKKFFLQVRPTILTRLFEGGGTEALPVLRTSNENLWRS